jgi:membrane-bound lytic murein transglycosylase D
MEQIAAVCQLDLDMLRALNPQYRQNIVNGNTKPSILRLPNDAVNLFIDNEDSIYAYNVEKYLGRRAEVDIVEDMAQNIRPARTSVSPRGKRAAVERDRKAGRHGRDRDRNRRGRHRRGGGGEQSVTVKSGQTLSQIAKKNHTTVEKLRRLNGIKGSNIRAGKKLKVK